MIETRHSRLQVTESVRDLRLHWSPISGYSKEVKPTQSKENQEKAQQAKKQGWEGEENTGGRSSTRILCRKCWPCALDRHLSLASLEKTQLHSCLIKPDLPQEFPDLVPILDLKRCSHRATRKLNQFDLCSTLHKLLSRWPAIINHIFHFIYRRR
jgi:hypothetical protein